MTVVLEPSSAPSVELDLGIVTTHLDETRADVVAKGALIGASAVLLHQVLDSHIRAGRVYLRLNLTAVSRIDDAGVAAIAGGHDRLFARRGTLILTGLSPDLRTEFVVRGLERRLLILGSVA